MTNPPSEFTSVLVAAVPRLRRFCYALTGSVSEADDLLQSALEKALSKWQQFEQHSHMDRWLFRICRNHWIDNIRTMKHRGEEVSMEEFEPATFQGEDGETVTTATLTLAKVQTGMLSLSENLREVLYLVGVEGLGYQEVADLLNIPIGTVMSRLARARSQLVDNLGL